MVKVGKFNLPDELYYADDHVWARIEDGNVKVGLNDFGQHIAGKILFTRIRPQGRPVVKGKAFSSIETGVAIAGCTAIPTNKITANELTIIITVLFPKILPASYFP